MNFPILLPSRKEMSWGWRYLAFEAVFLLSFLKLAINLLRLPLGSIELNLLLFFLNFAAVMLIFHRFFCRSLCLPAKRVFWIGLIAVAGFGIYYALFTAVSALIVWIDPGFYNLNDASISAISQKYYWPTVFCTVFLVPTTEELLHRGAVFGSLRRKNRFVAYLVSTLTFATMHITANVGHYTPATLLLCYLQYLPAGLCLAAAYDLSGSILPPILIHTAVNVVATLAMR